MTYAQMLFDDELIAILEQRGYIVRHKSEATRLLSWNREAPLPDDLDFKAEAVEKIREQITPNILHFETRSALDKSTPEIRSAFLRII